MQEWGDKYLPWPNGPTIERRTRDTDRPVHVGFIDGTGREVHLEDVATRFAHSPR